MSVIEQAAKRLEELRRAGVQPVAVPGTGAHVVQEAIREGGQDGVPGTRPKAGSGATVDGLSTAGAQPTEAMVRRDQDGAQAVAIDFALAAENGFLLPNAPRSRLADEFRAAKHGLLKNVRGQSAAPGARANCIMVTSALPGEGKTFTSVNLALSLAREIDLRALLIDADVVNPNVMLRLGLAERKGLLDLLADPELRADDVILRTNVDKLALLAAGTATDRSAELLASEGMDRWVREFAAYDPHRVVSFDGPPLLAVPEARQLASHVGQIVLVVEAQRTPKAAVAEALDLLKDHPLVLTVLNKARGGGATAYGYGGYGSGTYRPSALRATAR